MDIDSPTEAMTWNHDRAPATAKAPSTAADAAGRAARTAVDKAFELLAALPVGGTTAGITELSRRLALPKSTVYRLLQALERHGVVDRVENRYRLGCRLHELGTHVYEAQPGTIHEAVAPAMIHLQQKCRETVHLGVLCDGEVILLGRLHGLRSTPSGVLIGSRFPAHSSALGKAMLAHSLDEVERLLSGPLTSRTPHTIANRASLLRELEITRHRGIAISNQEARVNVTCVAVALLDDEDRPIAALAISAPSAGFDEEGYGGLLRRVAVGAQRSLRRAAITGSMQRT
jgi:IclR family transcriptional regulator, KDG regulon repressor